MISLDKIKELITLADVETEKVNRGNKAAKTRLRKIMMDLKKEAQSVREQVIGKED